MTVKAPVKKTAAPVKKTAAKPAAKPAAKAAPAAKAPAKAPTAKPAAKAAVATPEKIGLKELSASVQGALPVMTLATVTRVVEEVFAQMTAAIQGGTMVNVKDFGKLGVVNRPARTGRNPQTGAPVDIPAKSVLKFTPAKALKDAVA